MNRLPDELVLQIFKYVPSNDRRKSLRLVCQRWNQIAVDQIFTQEENIMTQKCSQYNWLSVFQTSRRGVFNLHFGARAFGEDELDHEFWRYQGGRIRSLAFKDPIPFTLTMFTEVISLCPNVKHISLDIYSPYRSCYREWMPQFHDQSNFTAKSVSSFFCYLNLRTSKLISDIIKSTLSCFPNLEELQMNIPNHSFGSINEPGFVEVCSVVGVNPGWCGKSSLGTIAQFIQSNCKQLKKLWLMEGGPSNNIYNTSIKFLHVLSGLKNLKELTISGSNFLKLTELQDLNDFLTQMPNLMVLNLSVMETNFPMAGILDQVLDSAPNLQMLCLDLCCPFFYSSLQIRKLLLSKLKTLHLTFNNDGPMPDFQLPLAAPVNLTLEELVVHSRRQDYGREQGPLQIFSIISPFLPNLRYLSLATMTDRDLQSIFKNQKFLRSLILDDSNHCSHFGYEGSQDGYSIKELKDLEYLKITDMNVALAKSETPLAFALPKLKRLDMYAYIGSTPDEQIISKLFEMSPKLCVIMSDTYDFRRCTVKRDAVITCMSTLYHRLISRPEVSHSTRWSSHLYCCRPLHLIPKWSLSKDNSPFYTCGCEISHSDC